MSEEKLPKGWKRLKLGEVLTINMGQSPPSSSYNEIGEGLPFFQGKTEFGKIYPSVKKYTTDPKKVAEENSVLLSVRAPVGPTNLAPFKCCIGRGLASISSRTIPLKYIFYFFRNIERELSQQGTGTTFSAINKSLIYDLDFPVPPLPEQQRIVAKLDAVFGHLDRVREKLDRIPVLLKNFRQQVLTQAVTGELTRVWREGKDLGEWDYVDLQEIADVVDPHPSHRTPPSEIDGVPYISIKDIDSRGLIDFQNSTLVSPKILEEHIKRYTLKEGDLGFGKIGTLGKPFRLPIFKERTYTLSANIILIQPKSNCNPKFLFYYLDSPIINKLLKEGAKATSQPAFGIKKARVFPTPNPSQEEQQEIVKRVDALFGLADKIEFQYQSLKSKIDQMPQAILAKAFRGELVAQEVKEYVREVGELGMVAQEGKAN